MATIKAFKVTANNQYIQDINLNAGEYTFSANIRADSASITVCKFSLLVGGVWMEYDLTDQIYIGQFQKVKKVIQLNDKATKLSLISSGSGGGRIFHVDRPMFEEGSNAGTPKPNEEDLEEIALIGNTVVSLGTTYYVFKTDTKGNAFARTITVPVYAMRGGKRVDVEASQMSIYAMPAGLTHSFAKNAVNLIASSNFQPDNRQVGIRVMIEDVTHDLIFYCEAYQDGQKGQNAYSPYIGHNGNWWEWDSSRGQYVDTGKKAQGEDGKDGINGDRGLPGKLAIKKLYKVDRTYYNNDETIDFIYYETGDSWWKLKDGVLSKKATTANPASDSSFMQISSVDIFIADTIIANNANLAGWIFKDGFLISQDGEGNPGTPSFDPNTLLDGKTGLIKTRNAIIEGTFKTPFLEIDPRNTTQFQAELVKGHNLTWKGTGRVPGYTWTTLSFPGGAQVDGMHINFNLPHGTIERYKLAIYGDIWYNNRVLPNIELVAGVTYRITGMLMKRLDTGYTDLFIHAMQTMMQSTSVTDNYAPAMFFPGDIIYRAKSSGITREVYYNKWIRGVQFSRDGNNHTYDFLEVEYFNTSGGYVKRDLSGKFDVQIVNLGNADNTVRAYLDYGFTSNRRVRCGVLALGDYEIIVRAADIIKQSEWMDI